MTCNSLMTLTKRNKMTIRYKTMIRKRSDGLTKRGGYFLTFFRGVWCGRSICTVLKPSLRKRQEQNNSVRKILFPVRFLFALCPKTFYFLSKTLSSIILLNLYFCYHYHFYLSPHSLVNLEGVILRAIVKRLPQPIFGDAGQCCLIKLIALFF